MISVIQETRELIVDAQLEQRDPALEIFFARNGTKHKLLPNIAFKNLLPAIPEKKDAQFKTYAHALRSEIIALFEIAFAKCKKHFIVSHGTN